ncbi:MAG: hypothetical protein M0D55_01630 [Elusimicrobiota bacterium]|nr:MAG: hypothetical protein M0D55_01630 [Elusimicrobiota bacterium]
MKKVGAPPVKVAPLYQLPSAAPEEIARRRLETPAGASVAVPAILPRFGPSAPPAGTVSPAVAALMSKVNAADDSVVWMFVAMSVAEERITYCVACAHGCAGKPNVQEGFVP